MAEVNAKESNSGQSLSWKSSILEATSALVAVIVADFLENIGTYGPYYVLGIFLAIIVGVFPAVVLAAGKKNDLLKGYKHTIGRFSVWLAAILVTNIFASAWNVFKLAPTIGPLVVGVFFLFVVSATRLMNYLLGSIGESRVESASSSRRRVMVAKALIRYWSRIVVFALAIGLVVGYVAGFLPALDPIWASVFVAFALVIATLLLARENRLFRLEAVKPTFGFEFGLWPIDGIPHIWLIKNTGAQARRLQIDIKQGDDILRLSIPSFGRDETMSLGQDFDERYDRGGKILVDFDFLDSFGRGLKDHLEIDIDDLKKSGKKLPYTRHPVASLEEIVDELRSIRSELRSLGNR